MTIKKIKMLDFASANEVQKVEFGKSIVQSAKTMGFLVLQDTAVSLDRQNEIFGLAKNFFEGLDECTRQELAFDKVTNRGLAGIGNEALDEQSRDVKETYNIGFEGTSVPNVWSKSPKLTKFNLELLKYAEECFAVTKDLLRALALGCDMPSEFFVDKHDRDSQTLRLLHYPCLQGSSENFSVSPHTDYGTLTLVYNCGATFSVQDLTTGQWHDVPAEPGDAVVNIADLLMRWTNNCLQSNPHRVKYSDCGKSSFMTAFFAHPSYMQTIDCLPTFVGNGKLYQPINSLEYINQRLAKTYKY